MIFPAIHTRDVVLWGPVILAFVAYGTFVLTTRMSVKARLGWTFLVGLAAMRGFAFQSFGGNPQAPSKPEWFILFFDFLYLWLVFLTAFSCVWWFRFGRARLLPLAAAVVAAVGQWNVFALPEVKEVEIRSARLPKSLDGYRITQLTDLHCCDLMRGWRTRKIVDLVNATKPDFIALTGDYVDGRISRLAEDLKPITELTAPDGVAMISGNHEFFIDGLKWRRWYVENGFNLLTNTCVFPRPGLAVAGFDDLGIRTVFSGRELQRLLPDVGRAFAAATNGEYRILLQHRPKFIEVPFFNHHVDLMITGHTHGGIMPVVRELIAHFTYNGHVRGLYRVGDGWLFVSPGVGQWTGLPLRLFTPSEITVFTLRRCNPE